MNKIKFFMIMFLAVSSLAGCNSFKKAIYSPCVSNSTDTTQQLVDSAACSLNQMRIHLEGHTIDHLLEEARAVFIFPDVYRAAFMVGAEAGAGVLCAKDDTGFWNGPAFFNTGSVDIGLQAGVEGKTILVFLMDDEALEDALGGKVTYSMGADLAIGRGQANSQRGSFDVEGNVLALYYQAGAYGGMGYRLGSFVISNYLNEKYYGQKVTVKELVETHKFDKPEADVLLHALSGI